MIWAIVAVVVGFVVNVFTVRWKTADKGLEILLLRQQLRVLSGNWGSGPGPAGGKSACWQSCSFNSGRLRTDPGRS